MLRARHARQTGRQPLDAVLRRPTVELFQPQGARVSSHLSFNCFVTLKAAPRGLALAASTAGGRARARGVMAGSVMRERVVVAERHIAPLARASALAVSSPILPLVSRRRHDGLRTVASGRDTASQRRAAGTAFSNRDGRASIGSISPPRMSADETVDGRVFAAPRGLLQTGEAAQAFGHMVHRLGRSESRVTPVPTVARRGSEAPRHEREGSGLRDNTLTASRNGIGMGMPTAMQMQAAADVNIEALASKVMQQIDRRLVAHRERMGRI